MYILIHVTYYICAPIPFFFHDTPTPDIYTLSLHDALPISRLEGARGVARGRCGGRPRPARPGLRARVDLRRDPERGDRKSTRLNSSHVAISYAVFCLKKKTHKLKKYRHTKK